eukprot:scaffold3870_cov246-Pinguiococcus_pyrenoidosus.AAC.3
MFRQFGCTDLFDRFTGFFCVGPLKDGFECCGSTKVLTEESPRAVDVRRDPQAGFQSKMTSQGKATKRLKTAPPAQGTAGEEEEGKEEATAVAFSPPQCIRASALEDQVEASIALQASSESATAGESFQLVELRKWRQAAFPQRNAAEVKQRQRMAKKAFLRNGFGGLGSAEQQDAGMDLEQPR